MNDEKLDKFLSALVAAVGDYELLKQSTSGPDVRKAASKISECILAIRNHADAINSGWENQIDILWDRRDAAENELDCAYDTISDLLDQCARLRSLLRDETQSANYYCSRFDEAEREIEELRSEKEDMWSEFLARDDDGTPCLIAITRYQELIRAERELTAVRKAAGAYPDSDLVSLVEGLAASADAFTSGHDAIVERLVARAEKSENKIKEVVAAAESVGWDGVNNSKHLSQFIIDLHDRAQKASVECSEHDAFASEINAARAAEVTALLDRLEQTEQERDRYRSGVIDATEGWRHAAAERDEFALQLHRIKNGIHIESDMFCPCDYAMLDASNSQARARLWKRAAKRYRLISRFNKKRLLRCSEGYGKIYDERDELRAKLEALAAKLQRWEMAERMFVEEHGLGGKLDADLVMKRISFLENELNSARCALSALSSYVGAGLGEDSTSIDDYEDRIRWGIDSHDKVWHARIESVERKLHIAESARDAVSDSCRDRVHEMFQLARKYCLWASRWKKLAKKHVKFAAQKSVAQPKTVGYACWDRPGGCSCMRKISGK